MVRLCTVGTIPLGIRYLTFFREIDVKIEVLRERLRKDAEERMVERRRSWHLKSTELETRAKEAATREMDQLRRELREEEQAISQQSERKLMSVHPSSLFFYFFQGCRSRSRPFCLEPEPFFWSGYDYDYDCDCDCD